MEDFLTACRKIPKPRVLELGTRRVIPGRSTKRIEWVPHAKEFIGVDMEMGLDVDVVADIHELSHILGKEKFDVIISCSTLEHIKYPHRAAHEILKTLRIDGLLFIQTHQTFPLHNFPVDYYRFSREALAGLFGTKMGFRVAATDYEFPAQINSEREPNVYQFEAFLNVRLFGKKINTTPDEYIYEL